MKKSLIMGISGKKGSGKSSMSKVIFAEYANKKVGKDRFKVIKNGRAVNLIDTFDNDEVVELERPNQKTKAITDTLSVKVYNFALPLKIICKEMFCLSDQELWGSEEEKNSKIHIEWENLPLAIAQEYKKVRRGTGELSTPTGRLTSRELLQIIGTFFRGLDSAAWARATYSLIQKDNPELAIISDMRYENEVTLGTENYNAKVIRLLRNPHDDKDPSETALDDFALGEYQFVLDNSKMSFDETVNTIKNKANQWFEEVGL